MKTYEPLQSFASWAQKQLQIIKNHQENDSILKLTKYDMPPYSSEPKIEIQLKGKNLFVKKTILELFSNDHILAAFSKNDIATLVRIHEKWLNSPKVKMTSHYFNCDTCFVNLVDKSGNEKQLTILEVTQDADIKASLSTKDSYMLGYLLGFEDGKEIRS